MCLRPGRLRASSRFRVRREIRVRGRRAAGTRDEIFRGEILPQRLKSPLRECLRLCSARRVPRASRPARAGEPALPPPWFAIATCEIAPPRPCTSARLRHALRLSRATAPIRMPPWHRVCVRRVLRVSPARRCSLSPCGYALGSVANRPWLSIVAASGARGQNLVGGQLPIRGLIRPYPRVAIRKRAGKLPRGAAMRNYQRCCSLATLGNWIIPCRYFSRLNFVYIRRYWLMYQ
jgi:hypothetical protein